MKAQVLKVGVSTASRKGAIAAIALIFGILFLQHAYQKIAFIRNSSLLLAEKPDVHEVPYDSAAAIKSILDADLFKSDEKPVQAALSPSITASIELRGTFAGYNNTPSYAIIALSGQPEHSYRVGDVIENNIKVDAIYTDYIIVNDGQSKTKIPLKTFP